jgi:hypothetical protein
MDGAETNTAGVVWAIMSVFRWKIHLIHLSFMAHAIDVVGKRVASMRTSKKHL